MTARRRVALAVLLVFAGLGTAGIARAEDKIDVTARLEPKVLSPDGSAILVVEVSAAGIGRMRAVPRFEVENFQPPGSPSRSESFEFVNGETRRSLTMTWRLRPLAAGPARVRGIVVALGDREISIPDLEATVDPNAPAPSAATGGASPFRYGDPFADLFGPRQRRRGPMPVTPKVLLRATIAPERVVVGEQALYTVKLYTQGDVSGIQPTALPRFERFWARDVPQPERPRATMVEIDGERYGEVVLLQRALFPLSAGAATIEPLAADIAVRLASADPWGRLVGEIETWRRQSNSVELAVDPLPPSPTGFSGAIGRLKLDATLEPELVEVGAATTLSVTFSGTGRVAGIQAPKPPELEGVRVFPPQDEGGDELRGTSVVGRRTWRYVMVPESSGTWALPPISLTYFDPAQDTYRVASAPALSLTAVAPPPVSATGTESGLEPIAEAPPPAPGVDWPSTIPWIVAAAFALALVVVVARQRLQGGGSPTARRHPEASSRQAVPIEGPAFRDRLEEALREERGRALAGAVEGLWRAELEHRHALPPSTPAAQWAARLGANGLSAEVIEDFRRLAEELHYLRYAPQLASTDAVRAELVARSRRLANQLG